MYGKATKKMIFIYLIDKWFNSCKMNLSILFVLFIAYFIIIYYKPECVEYKNFSHSIVGVSGRECISQFETWISFYFVLLLIVFELSVIYLYFLSLQSKRIKELSKNYLID